VNDELDEIQAIFFEECVEGLAAAEAGLSQMADGDTSAETIASVFRAVHSIKGGSGAFGHAALLAFSHRFENLLDEVRAGRISPSPGVVKELLGAFDILADHVTAAQEQSAPPADQAMLDLLDEILASKGAGLNGAAPAPEPLAEPAQHVEADEFGFTPVTAVVEEFDPFGFEPVPVALEELEAPVEEAGDWVVRFGPSRDAMANGGEPLLVVRELERLGGQVVAVDSSALPSLREVEPEDSYFVWTLSVPETVEHSEIGECFDFVVPDSLIEISRAGQQADPSTAADPVESASEPSGQAPVAIAVPVAESPVISLVENRPADQAAMAGPKGEKEQGSQTIRADLSKLDQLLNLVGELVIRGSILADRLSPADQERVELPQLARLNRQIQDSVMSLRAQPIKQAFSRVPRMLRELSIETRKQVSLEVEGEATEVDKSVIEKIGDPLTHMIRNAVDHGIEEAAERLAAGKPAEGRLRLSAEQKGARIFVRVRDDGRGIDRESASHNPERPVHRDGRHRPRQPRHRTVVERSGHHRIARRWSSGRAPIHYPAGIRRLAGGGYWASSRRPGTGCRPPGSRRPSARCRSSDSWNHRAGRSGAMNRCPLRTGRP
jgi:two-component system chemotaxis sensor kinase CheA